MAYVTIEDCGPPSSQSSQSDAGGSSREFGPRNLSTYSTHLVPLPLYDPHSWRETLFATDGRPFSDPETRGPLYAVWGFGTVLVTLSAIIGVIGDEGSRHCRAWCSHFALGPQPHSYIGVILFLLMAFRSNQAYASYASGLTSWTVIRKEVLQFCSILLNSVPRDSIEPEERVRMISFAAVFPFALAADLDESALFPEIVSDFMSENDLSELRHASNMPCHVVEMLLSCVSKYCSKSSVPPSIVNHLNRSANSLIEPYTITTRIKENPVVFSYVAHLRLLLILYLCALPLALVESLGWATVPVFYVISYCLLSLEIIAVEIQDPFNGDKNDLRLADYNFEICSIVGNMHRRWVRAGQEDVKGAKENLEHYKLSGFEKRFIAPEGRYKTW